MVSRGWLASALPSLMASALIDSRAEAEGYPINRTITVSATRSALAGPDAAQVQTGLVTEGKSARQALSANNSTMAKLIAGLKQSGVEPIDIQTSGFTLNPRYTNPRDGQPPLIDGYQATNGVEVYVRNLEGLGGILDSLVSLGANQMNGIVFEVSEADTLRDEARKDAVAKARRYAEVYAAAAGASVGKVMVINEGGSAEHRPYFKSARAAAYDSVPIERGNQSIEANVTITWALD